MPASGGGRPPIRKFGCLSSRFHGLARPCVALERLIANNPVVGLVGARQVGKTTLARDVAGRRAGPTHIFDLDDL